MSQAEKDQIDEENRAAMEHRDVLLATRSVLMSSSGKVLFRYFFKHFDVAQPIPMGFSDEQLREYIGLQRAGNSIFKIASEANFQLAGALLSEVEKERYAKLVSENS